MPPKLTINSDLTGLPVVKCVRKSSLNTAAPTKSTDDQMTDLDENCARRGLVEFKCIVEKVQGASAYSKTLDRSKFDEALRLITENNIAVLAYWDLSRSARRLVIHGRLMETLEATNTLLMIGDRLYDASDPNDRMALGFNAVMDENQVARSRAASMRGMRESAKLGRPHGIEVYGYKRIYEGRGRNPELARVEIVPSEAAIIVEIIDRLLAGDSQSGIAADLTARRVPRPRAAPTWWPTEIRDIVDRDAYMGIRTHTDWRSQEVVGSYEAMWPAIIDPDKMKRCRALLAIRNTGKGGIAKKTAKYLLTGLISCGRCGSRIYGDHTRPSANQTAPRAVYQCRQCRLTRLVDMTDQLVLDIVNAWLRQPEIVNAFADATGAEDPDLVVNRAALVEARRELDEAYEMKLSAKGLAAMERQWLPEIDRLQQLVTQGEERESRTGWRDLASGRVPLIVPQYTAEARDYLARIIRVTVLPLGRGVRFHAKCVRVSPLGVPDKASNDDS